MMKRFVPAFAVPLTLVLGLVQGDSSLPSAAPLALENGSSYSVTLLPGTLGQTPAPNVLVPIKPGQPLYQLHLGSPPVSGPGDKIPHSYSVYGLRTGPGGMAFTDRNGVALPVPSQPRLLIGPPVGTPVQPFFKVPPGTSKTPYYAPRPVPKK